MKLLPLLLCLLTIQIFSQRPVDPAPKLCVVTEVVKEGVRSDCGTWRPANGEKISMPTGVSKVLKVGDTFYFAWNGNRWIARAPVEVLLPDPVAVIVSDEQPTILMKRCEAFKQYESLVKKEKTGAEFSKEDIKLYPALRKALFTFSSASRPEAPNGSPVSGDISGCVKPTGTVL